MKSRTKRENKFEFFDKVLDKKRSFKANEDELVVSLNVNQMETMEALSDDANSLLSSAKVVDLECGFAVVDKQFL